VKKEGKKMYFKDARVKQEFVEYVLALQDPIQQIVTKEFLEKFLGIIIDSEQNPKRFNISLTNACEWLSMEKKNFKRHIDSDYSKHPTGFEKGKDFEYVSVKDEQNRQQQELFMTIDTFKKAASLTRGTFGKQIQSYIWLIEKAFRDWLGSSFSSKYTSNQNTAPARNTVIVPPTVHLSEGIGNYTIQFNFEGQGYYYTGITDNIRARLQKHAIELPTNCELKVIEWTPNESAELVEKCRENLAHDSKVPVPETLHGMRSLFYENQPFWNEVTSYCDIKMKEDIQNFHPTHQPNLVPLSSPQLYPVRKNKKGERKKKHSWLDNPIASYSSEKNK
jgi:phage anti-repressor protein